MLPKLSIIIPVYNAEKFISKCLDSIFQQDFKDLEVIAVNDGSVDKSEQILSNYAKKEPRLRFFSQDNQGVVAARNLGLYSSEADWVMFVDSDDYLLPGCLSRMLQEAFDTYADIVIAGMIYDYGQKKVKRRNEQPEEDTFQGWSKALLTEKLSPGLCARIYKRFLFNNVCVSSEFKIGEDFITSILLFNNSDKIVLVDYYCYGYVQHIDSVMHRPSKVAIESIPKFIKWVIDYYSEGGFDMDINFKHELATFVLNRYYLYLIWGGSADDKFNLRQIIKHDYINIPVVRKNLEVWRYLLLRMYSISPILGDFSRIILNFVKNKI